MKTKHVIFAGFKITRHDLQIISLVVQTLERWQMADKLGIAVGTLNHEMTLLFRKVQVKNSPQLIKLALANNFDQSGRYHHKKLI